MRDYSTVSMRGDDAQAQRKMKLRLLELIFSGDLETVSVKTVIENGPRDSQGNERYIDTGARDIQVRLVIPPRPPKSE